MTKPTWVKVVGVLAIVFGCTSLLGSMQFTLMPFMLEMQRSFLYNIDDLRDAPPGIIDFFDQMTDLPAWFDSAAIVIGLIGLLIAGFYLFSGIMFLSVKKNAVKFMIAALILMIIDAFIKVALGVLSGTFIAISLTLGGVVSIIIDLVLLITIAVNDKSVFYQVETAPLQQPPVQ